MVCFEFRLPLEKIRKICFLLSVSLHSSKATVRMVQSLGLLAFASRVMPMGWIFCRRTVMVIGGIRNLIFHVVIIREMKENFSVWYQFCKRQLQTTRGSSPS